MKRLLALMMVSAFVLACDSEPKFMETEDGLKYRLLTDEPGQNLQANDLLVVKMSQFINDSVVFETPSKLGDVLNPMQNVPPQLKTVLDACSAGDSVEIEMTFKQYVEMTGSFYPRGVDSLDLLRWRIKVSDMGPESEVIERYEAKLDELSAEQLKTDIGVLKTLADDNNLEYQETEEGVLYVVLEEGNGEFPQIGQKVSVNYTVRMMDSTFVDSSNEELAKANNVYNPQRPYGPIEFDLGGPGIIQGWNMGIPKFSKGGKGVLLVPSKFAYGERGRGQIGPNTNLIFDIEVVDFK